ncbi:Golgin subfamily A member 7/ERF4 family-domain-containing protein [Thelephora terrestris]|uniref:Ras modification protein ERF4 n=1 Tax=Thelephora terrestris TaxID=56493 RepID=A0A9P6HEY6_9AGAM|nr:Golgin subfamily A member 7/ERF4 family-domain-containing protein [Thelephora terrestris]
MRATNTNTSAPVVITTTLDLRRTPSVSTASSSSSRRPSTPESSEFKRSDTMADGDSIDNSKPLDRVYTPATMSRASINMPQSELPSGTVSSLPEASNFREFTSPTPSGDSSPPPTQFTGPFTTLTRPGDEDLFVKVPLPPNTTGSKDPRTRFTLPSPPLTRVGTKSTQKSTPSRPGSGPREGQSVEEREEVDVTDNWKWQDPHANHPSSSSDPEGCSEGEGNVGFLRRTTATHPLELNIPSSSCSPPPWEVTGPPEGSEDIHRVINETLTTQRTSKRLIPKSSYYYGPPPPDTAFGTDPIGQIGIHHPREIVRVERDYSGGEIIQFSAVYPLEFEGRITPTQFLESINAINEILISAHSLSYSCLDNMLAFLTLQLSRLVTSTHYEKEMSRLHRLIDDMNKNTFNPVGLNVVWPKDVAFLFLEIEYYVCRSSLHLSFILPFKLTQFKQ